MNNDLISREALKAHARKVIRGDNPTSTLLIRMFDEIIDNAPTVDIKDEIAGAYNEGYMCGNKEAEKARPQGKWYYSYLNGWHCSICNETVKDMPTVMGKAYFNFCPNCGADMRKGGAV